MRLHFFLGSTFALAACTPLSAQPLDATLFAPLKWRCIGPFRGGRTVGATGVPGKPNLFYIGVNNGGVWKRPTPGGCGRRYSTISRPVRSAAWRSLPSNPDVIYVGSGEGLQRPDLSTGDGVYVSRDAGKTWTNTGLRDGQQISARRRGSEGREPGVRRSARPPIRRQRRARRLPHNQRGQNVAESTVQGREHRGDRAGIRSG